jgi:hypothetical protein
MDIEPIVIAVAIALVGLGLVVWLSYRLLRWARAPVPVERRSSKRLQTGGMKVTRVRVESFTISLDGYGAGPALPAAELRR